MQIRTQPGVWLKTNAVVLSEVLIHRCVELVRLDGPLAVVRIDPAPDITTVVDDKFLQHHRIAIETSRENNKNPMAENAIRELEVDLPCKIPVQ